MHSARSVQSQSPLARLQIWPFPPMAICDCLVVMPYNYMGFDHFPVGRGTNLRLADSHLIKMRKRQMAKVQLIGPEHIKAIGELSISGKCRYDEPEKNMIQPSPKLPHRIERVTLRKKTKVADN